MKTQPEPLPPMLKLNHTIFYEIKDLISLPSQTVAKKQDQLEKMEDWNLSTFFNEIKVIPP